MKKFINISLYTIIFLLVASICVISIKKFFDINGKTNKISNIIATNFVTKLVSFNEIETEKVIEDLNEDTFNNEPIEEEKDESVDDTQTNNIIENEIINETIVEETTSSEEITIADSNILFDGLTESDLITKLERSLKNELSGTSINFVEYYKTTGLDPYLAVAIVLHETGCSWTCSSLVRECYNYGGMKGGENTYKDTRYTCYSSKEEGINAYLNMLYNNYYAKGLTTAELINPKYATSLEWSVKINSYIEKIKNS